MLCRWRQCKKGSPFTKTKISIRWSLVVHYQTWQTFALLNLQMQSFIPSRWQMKTYLRNFEKMLLVDHLSFLLLEHSLMKLSFGNRRAYANLLSQLRPANCIHVRFVNLCRSVFIRVVISIQKREVSHLDKTRLGALKVRPCPIFNEQDQIVKLIVSTQQADKEKCIQRTVYDLKLKRKGSNYSKKVVPRVLLLMQSEKFIPLNLLWQAQKYGKREPGFSKSNSCVWKCCVCVEKLLQCWWFLFSVQTCVWSHALFLPFLSPWRNASLPQWRGDPMWI